MSSDEDGAELMAAFKSAGTRKAAPPASRSTHSVQDSDSEDTLGREQNHSQAQAQSQSRWAVCVRVKPANRRDEFVYYEAEAEIEEIIRSYPGKKVLYDVRMSDGTAKQVSAFGKGSPTERLGRGKGRAGASPGLWICLYTVSPDGPLSVSSPHLI
jgi:hypothetical protein